MEVIQVLETTIDTEDSFSVNIWWKDKHYQVSNYLAKKAFRKGWAVPSNNDDYIFYEGFNYSKEFKNNRG